MLNELAKEVRKIAVAHGWTDDRATFAEYIALCHSELSEALEAYREGRDEDIEEELADTIIRVLDLSVRQGINIEKAVIEKMNKNRNREHMHGGKRL